MGFNWIGNLCKAINAVAVTYLITPRLQAWPQRSHAWFQQQVQAYPRLTVLLSVLCLIATMPLRLLLFCTSLWFTDLLALFSLCSLVPTVLMLLFMGGFLIIALVAAVLAGEYWASGVTWTDLAQVNLLNHSPGSEDGIDEKGPVVRGEDPIDRNF